MTSADTEARPGANRRAVVRGAAWTLPVVAVATAAPAFAVSSCGQVLDWDSFTSGMAPPLTTTVSGVNITRSYAPIAGGVVNPSNDFVLNGPRGGVSEKALAFAVNNPTTGRGLALTFNFSPAVYDLQFSIFDIDRLTGGWQDRVTPSAGYSVVGTAGGNVVAQGGTTFTATTNNNLPDTSSAGNVTLKYSGSVSSITLSYVCGNTDGAGNMAVFISDLTFCLRP